MEEEEAKQDKIDESLKIQKVNQGEFGFDDIHRLNQTKEIVDSTIDKKDEMMMQIDGQDEFLHNSSHAMQQHLLANQLISEFERKELNEFESPFFALKYFIKSNLHQEGQQPVEDLRNGKQFKVELAMYVLKTMIEITPPLWKTILNDVYEIVEENIYTSPHGLKAQKEQQNTKADNIWDFKETYKSLYDDIKHKFNNVLRSTKKIREMADVNK